MCDILGIFRRYKKAGSDLKKNIVAPKAIHLSAFVVSGPTVRTRNSNEVQPETAKIAGLWTRFFTENTAARIPNACPDAVMAGVYSQYENDCHGAFSVTAGISVSSPNTTFECVTVEAGEYLVFKAKGPMPEAIIHAWDTVWAYFEHHPQVQRRYLTDIELYSAPEHAHIYIGIVSQTDM